MIQNIKQKFYTRGKKISEMKMYVKHIWRKCYRKFGKIAKKIDKLSIKD